MTYILDSGPLIIMFRHYYPDRFPSLWSRFDAMVEANEIISVSEVARELDGQEDRLSQWVKDNKRFFYNPTSAEMTFVAKIFEVPHFQGLIRQQRRLRFREIGGINSIDRVATVPTEISLHRRDIQALKPLRLLSETPFDSFVHLWTPKGLRRSRWCHRAPGHIPAVSSS